MSIEHEYIYVCVMCVQVDIFKEYVYACHHFSLSI